MTTHLFADSLGASSGASDPAVTGWFPKFLAATGLTGNNKARPGGMVGDSAAVVYGTSLAAGDSAIIAFGVNDQRTYGVSSDKLGYFIDGLRNHAIWLASGAKQTARSVAGETGAWSDTGILGIGRSSTSVGSKKQFTVSGETVYLSVLRVEAGGGTATYSVKVDGVAVGTFDSSAPGVTSPHTGTYPYTERLHQFAGLSAGDHVVTVEMTGGSNLYVQWAAGNTQTTKHPVFICNIPYPNGYQWGGSAANIDAYNAAITGLIAELVADGFDVKKIDINAAISPAIHCHADGLHLNDAGYAVYSDSAAAVVVPAPAPSPAPAPAPAPAPEKTWVTVGTIAKCVEDGTYIFVAA